MALTTLNVDNEYYAKPWEFKEEQLACCPDLSVIKRRGITFAQLTCLASIHGLDVIRATHANNSGTMTFHLVNGSIQIFE